MLTKIITGVMLGALLRLCWPIGTAIRMVAALIALGFIVVSAKYGGEYGFLAMVEIGLGFFAVEELVKKFKKETESNYAIHDQKRAERARQMSELDRELREADRKQLLENKNSN